MRRGRIFRRRFDFRMDRQQTEAGPLELQMEKMRESAGHLAEQARDGLEKGKQAMINLETAVAARLQERPGMFLGVALGLIGLFIALRLYRRQHQRQFHDW